MRAQGEELLEKLKDHFEEFSIPEDSEWFLRAMTHRSYANEQDLSYDNERLEFLGDAVIDLVVCEHLFNEYEDRLEGELSEIKSAVVDTGSLTKIARRLDLQKFLRLSKGEERVARGRDKVIADTFEAFVGAMFLSFGLQTTSQYILPIFKEKIEQFIEEGTRNYKGKLLEWTQEYGYSQPEYRVEEVKGPQHRPKHMVSVLVEGEKYGSGTGRTKKEAEQEAAREALADLNDGNKVS